MNPEISDLLTNSFLIFALSILFLNQLSDIIKYLQLMSDNFAL